MSPHVYPYIKVDRRCKNCGKQIPGRSGHYCQAEACQHAKSVANKQYMRAWALKTKRWLKRDRKLIGNNVSEKKVQPRPDKARFCQYEFCPEPKKSLPAGWYFYHHRCHIRMCDILDRGIDS